MTDDLPYRKKNITINSMRVAGYLMLKGFILVGLGTSEINNKRFVFHFKRTDGIFNALKNYRINTEGNK